MTTISPIPVPSPSRLQMSLGAAAALGMPLRSQPDRTVYRATNRDTGDALIVYQYAPPPVGPDASALRDRVDNVRRLGHPLIDLPVATGEVDGCAWTVERVLGATLRQRTMHELLPLADGVAALRDLARALTTLHRHGMVHGAVGLDSVVLTDLGAVLIGGAVPTTASVRADLEGLSRVAWTLFTGERINARGRYLSQVRRGVPPKLDALCMALFAFDPAARPATADAVLAALDDIPTPKRGSPAAFILDANYDVRSRPRLGASLLLAIGAALALCWVVLHR